MLIHPHLISSLSPNLQSDNADPDEVQLDEEMEKVFAGSEKDKLPFSDRKASTGGKLDVIAYNNALPVGQDGNAPQVSERASQWDHLDEDEEEKRHVTFNKPGETAKSLKEEDEDHRRRKTRSQHYKQRKHSLGDGQGSRKASTAETGGRRISVQPEDADLQVRVICRDNNYSLFTITVHPTMPPLAKLEEDQVGNSRYLFTFCVNGCDIFFLSTFGLGLRTSSLALT